MELYIAEGKNLEEINFSVLETYLGQWHHVYQDKYYNSVEITEKLHLRKRRVFRTTRDNRRSPNPLADYSKKLKMDALLHIWKGKREVRMISTLLV
jgi:hypothetical protein